jgi:hypothetical protein
VGTVPWKSGSKSNDTPTRDKIFVTLAPSHRRADRGIVDAAALPALSDRGDR